MSKLPLEIIYTSIAFGAGITKEIQNYLDHKDVSIWTILARGCVACFSGYMFAQTIALFDPNLAIIASGVGGWMGPSAMNFIEYFLKKNFTYEKK